MPAENTEAYRQSGGRSDVDELAAADEVLQVMYWLHGEGLASEVSAPDLVRWVDRTDLGALLERLAGQGLLRLASRHPRRYALTERGVEEGGRRFADEFSDLTRQAHGECGDPDCECQRTGDPADCAHRAR